MRCFQYISGNKIETLMSEIKRVSKNGSLFFAIFPMASTQASSTDINSTGIEHYQTREFWNSIAGKLGMKDGYNTFYPKMCGIIVNGRNFMNEYKWNIVVYKIVK
jgi:hypothetical protein